MNVQSPTHETHNENPVVCMHARIVVTHAHKKMHARMQTLHAYANARVRMHAMLPLCTKNARMHAARSSSIRVPLLIATALRSAAEGMMASSVRGAPEGYQPSTKYCRASAIAPALIGVAMLHCVCIYV